MQCKEEIIVLKEIKYKEFDKILHAYSKNNGKIQIISRGCRKPKSKLISVSNIFSHSKCILYKSKDMYILNSADLIHNFYKLRENIELFYYGSYILELIYYITNENDVDNKIFDMTLIVLSKLEKNFNTEIIIAAYELKLVSLLGYRPNLTTCLNCGIKLEADAMLVIEEGGFYCKKCNHNMLNGKKMMYKEIETMGKILMSKFENLNDITNINHNVIKIIRNFLFYHIGKKNFTSLKILEKGDIIG